MAEQESVLARNANKHFRKEAQVERGRSPGKEYNDLEAATRLKTAGLRAQRLARDASLASAAVPSPKAIARTPLQRRSFTRWQRP